MEYSKRFIDVLVVVLTLAGLLAPTEALQVSPALQVARAAEEAAAGPAEGLRGPLGPVPAARPAAAVHTVCPSGPPACEHGTIQGAVDAAEAGDLIKVAGGVYSGVQDRLAPPGYQGPEKVIQVVYLSKTVTIRGGYTTSNGFADPPDPHSYPTIVDAQGKGRVFFIGGEVNPILEGLRITGGDATGQGGDPLSPQAGGGIYVITASATLNDSAVFGNTAGPQGSGGGFSINRGSAFLLGNSFTGNSAGSGGALNLWLSSGSLADNIITANTAISYGGGLHMWYSPAALISNTISANAGRWGGGMQVGGANNAVIAHNTVVSNSASAGGGMFIQYSGWIEPVDLIGNTFSANGAYWGGGMYLLYAPVTFTANLISENTATRGGGLDAFSSGAVFDRNTFAANEAYSVGGAVRMEVSMATFRENSFSGNSAYSGGGLYLYGSTATVEDNTFVDNTAVFLGGGGTLWYSSCRFAGNKVISNSATYGGGLGLYDSDSTLSDNRVTGNGAGYSGGGLELWSSPAFLEGNVITANTAITYGGGLHLSQSPATLLSNTISANTARWGAGASLEESAARLRGNTISANRAVSDGAGLELRNSPAVLEGNRVLSNVANRDGGGLYLQNSPAIISSSTILSNSAQYGGGLYLNGSDDALLVNDVVANNRVTTAGSGVYLISSAPHLWHNTLACNRGGDGSGVLVASDSTAALTNTIIACQTLGIQVSAGSQATLEGTLWGGGAWANGTDWSGSGTIVTGTVNVWGNPAFVDPAQGDYHIGQGSAAIDAGVAAGVAVDIDGEPRPLGQGPDIGADELAARLVVLKQANAEMVAAGSMLTYTLFVSNTGWVPFSATIVDVLPAQVSPTGLLSWTAEIAAGAVWMEIVVVTVAPGYAGRLANVVAVTTDQRVASAYTCTVTVEDPIAGLAASNDGPTVLGDPTTLSATVTAGSVVSYSWSFGDGQGGSGAVASHSYGAVGAYTAVVTASNRVSLATAQTVVIVTVVGPTYRLYLPLVLLRH